MKKEVEEKLIDFFEQQKESDRAELPSLDEIMTKPNRKQGRKILFRWAAAALLLAFSSTSYFYYQHKTTPPESKWFRYEAKPNDQLLDWDSPTDFLIP